MPGPQMLCVYQFKVVLRGVSPMIWRRLLLRSDHTIADLHYVIQIFRSPAFGLHFRTYTSVPHLTHPRGKIGTRGGSGCSRAVSGVYRPSPAFEVIEDGVRNEPATRREHVRVTVSVLLAPVRGRPAGPMNLDNGRTWLD